MGPPTGRCVRMHRIIVIDDQAMLRDSLRVAISLQQDMEVVATLSDAALALDAVEKHSPDLVLMDVFTEGGHSGIVATREIKAAHPEVRVLVMTSLPEITFVRQVREAGADGFVYKDISTTDLLAVIRSTMAGYSTFPSERTGDLSDSGLTQEEVRIVRLFCEAKSRREIAQELCLSEGTVKRRISEILAKTGYDSILHLAVDAISKGYIVPRLEE
jgi:DNA-binding NarL/FixJ family response regulator